MSDVLEGLALVFQPYSLLALLVGLTLGFVVGILPGFSSTNAAAILLPFTLVVPFEVSLVLLMGIYAGANFSGAVPAILVNVPGEASSAATALDGYPMARQGKAELAIGIARMASVAGGLLGGFICLVLIGPLAGVAIEFGSVELFLLAVVGLTVISSVIGDNVIKGMMAALLGIAISAMSVDAIVGVDRFTMGIREIYDEVPFIPILIGVFAIAQMLDLIGGERSLPAITDDVDEAPPVRRWGLESVTEVWKGVRVTLSYPVEVVRATLIGTSIGIAPGTGTAIANFVAYSASKQASKTPQRFGKGAPEGIIASEAADNAAASGTMVPTLALGVPGGGTAAVILAMFYMQGISPGPQLMQSHAAEAYAVLLSLLVASVLILPLGILLAVPMLYVSRLHPRVLGPVVIVIALIGAYSVRYIALDMVIAVLFGLLGLLMRRTGYPAVPLVMGLLLGPILESNFLRALRLGDNDPLYFFSTDRPLALVLWGVFVLMILFNLSRWWRSRGKVAEPETADPDDAARLP